MGNVQYNADKSVKKDEKIDTVQKNIQKLKLDDDKDV